MNSIKFYTAFFLLFTLQVNAQSNQDSTVNKKALTKFLVLSGTAYTASIILLNEVWYSQYPRDKFQFFNDNAEWYQMDKAGHIFTAFHLAKASNRKFISTGLTENKSLLYSSLFSIAAMTPIEWLDGYSTAYGASIGDLGANFLGVLLFIGREKWLDGHYFTIKYSFYPSEYAQFRPNVLGETYFTQWLKDYNGQTYWLSLDLDKITPVFPKWLNIGLGIGANGMVYARKADNSSFGYNSYRELYIGIDPDLSGIKSKKKWVNKIISTLDLVHIPAPVLEFGNKEVKIRMFR